MAISAKDICVPPQSQFEMLQSLLKSAGANRNDQAQLLILALIGDGINTIGEVIAAAVPLGFKRGHIATVLKHGVGSDWRCGVDGVYTLIE